MVHLLGRRDRHREPIDPQVCAVMLLVDRHGGVAVAARVRHEPHRVKSDQDRAFALREWTGHLERDAEILPVELVDDLGIALDGKRYGRYLRRRTVRPRRLVFVFVLIIVIVVIAIVVIVVLIAIVLIVVLVIVV